MNHQKPIVSSPLSGMFRSPVGAWVSPVRFSSGALWFKPLKEITRRNVLGALQMTHQKTTVD